MPKSAVLPEEVAAIRREIDQFLNAADDLGRVVGNAKHGVYAFFDYDGEPIYVGQTAEKLRARIKRHLTNQRTDAVAMNVLDPFEVAEIEVWPFFELSSAEPKLANTILAAAEYTVFSRLLASSRFNAVLNEADIKETSVIDLPPSVRRRIIPAGIFERRQHPDVRIARRASTIASLARVISERDVSRGLRRTLLTQARRLEWLASHRLQEIQGPFPVERPGSETGE